MKKEIIFISHLLITNSFAFWKMDKNPWYQGFSFKESQPLSIDHFDICQLETEKCNHVCICNYLFLYNRETGYSIGCADINYIDFSIKNLDYMNFFRCTRRPLFGRDPSLSFIFIEEKENLPRVLSRKGGYSKGNKIINQSEEGESAEKLLNGCLVLGNNCFKTERYHRELFELNENFKTKRIVKLSKQFSSDSGVLIDNKEEGVEISQNGGKPRDFQRALSYYFETHNRNLKFAKDIANSKKSGQGLSARLLNSLKFEPFKEEIALLESSKISAVFGIFKSEKGSGSVIWGLAEDINTHKEFHWITELGEDVSILTTQ